MGTFRFLLAFLVMLSHLPGAYMPTNYGLTSVFGFYCLSGWLMAMSFRKFQSRTPRPIRAFYIDRFIKIWPLYALVLSLTVLLFVLTGVRQVDLQQVVLELFLLPNAFARLHVWGAFNIVPPSWSLGVEAVFYLTVPLLAWASFRAKIALLYILIPLHIAVLATGAPIGAFIDCGWPLKPGICQHPVSDYFGTEFPLLASIPFLIGFVAYDSFARGRGSGHLLICWALYVLAFSEGNKVYPFAANLGTHEVFFAIIFVVPVALWLLRTRTGQLPSALDQFLGDLSYPLFLSHFLAIYLVEAVLGADGIVDYALLSFAGGEMQYLPGKEAVLAALSGWSLAENGIPLILPVFVLQVVPLALLLAFVLARLQTRGVDHYRIVARGFASSRPGATPERDR